MGHCETVVNLALLFALSACSDGKTEIVYIFVTDSDTGSIVLDSGTPEDSGASLGTASDGGSVDTGEVHTDTGDTGADTGSGDTGEPEEVDPCAELLGYTEWDAVFSYYGDGLVNLGSIEGDSIVCEISCTGGSDMWLSTSGACADRLELPHALDESPVLLCADVSDAGVCSIYTSDGTYTVALEG